MTDSDVTNKIEQIVEWIANAKHLVAFTGAGISTESGIPDFRGPNGVWTRKDKGLPPPKMKKEWHQVQPNDAHKALVELQKMGVLKFLISQNVDNLHLQSGIHPTLLSELHGNRTLMVCTNCNKKMTFEEAKWDISKWGPGYRTSPFREGQPSCPECAGRIMSSIVNFGDPLPELEYKQAFEHSEKADVYLIIGSSLVVTPAADLPKIAIENKAKVILLNKGETPFDQIVDIKVEASAGQIMTAIVKKLKEIVK